MAWTPILKIGAHWGEPSHKGFQLDLTGEALLRLAKVPPGEMTNLVLNPLSKETQFIEDPLAGQIPFRPREISPTYAPRWIPTAKSGAMAWLQPPMPQELAQRKAAQIALRAQIQKLADKAEKSFSDVFGLARQLGALTPEAAQAQWDGAFGKLQARERAALAGLIATYNELDEKSSGFLETVPNIFGTGASGVRWNFAVPNVEKILLSSWGVQDDQTQIIRFKRLFNLPGQVRPEWGIYIGNGRTQYALVFANDEAVEFRHYTNIRPSERARLEARLRAVLESGHLSAADKAQLAQWQAQIDVIKKGAKGAKLSGANKDTIAALTEKIETLRHSKSGLTDAAQQRAADIEKKLYYARVPISLQEDARSLNNQEVTVALRFHRKGFVSIRIGLGAQPGKEAFYYEIEGVTKHHRPHRILPEGSHLMIRSNGGPFGVAYGVANFAARATLYTQPFEIDFPFIEDEWKFTFDAIGLRDEDAEGSPDAALLKLPRARIEGRMEQVEPYRTLNGVTRPAKVRACLDFISEPHPKPTDKKRHDPLAGNHDYGVELYRATVTCVAGAPPDPSGIVWDSRTEWPIEDVQLSSNGGGGDPAGTPSGAMHEVFLADSPRKNIHLPLNLSNRYCELGMVDTREGSPTRGHYVPLETGGVLLEPQRNNARFFARGDALSVGVREATSAHLLVCGLDTHLQKPVEVPLIGNNERPNEYLRALFLTHGVTESMLAGLPAGQLDGMERLPPPPVGSYPDIKPNVGDLLWNYALSIVASHCAQWRLRCEPALPAAEGKPASGGIVIERTEWRDCRARAHYRTDVPYRNQFSIHRDPQSGNGLHLYQDDSEFWTDVIVTGAYNPGQGKRHSAQETVWEAAQKTGSAWYRGQRKIYRTPPDNSLRDRWRCILAARGFMRWHGLPPYFVRFTTWYDPDRRRGDLIFIDGIEVVVRDISYTRFARGAEQKMTLEARLAQNIATSNGGVL